MAPPTSDPARERAPSVRLGALLALLLLLLASCTEPPKPFRVGSNVWIGYESLYLARSLGAYEGTPIQLVEMTNATEVITALRAGVLEAAALTLDEALTVQQDGFGLRVVLVMDTSNGADALLARPELADLPALRGKRIGVESSAVGAVLLHGALESAGMTGADVELVHLPVDRHVDTWMRGEVDAIVTLEPVLTELLRQGARLLFDSSRIPGRIIDVLVARSDLESSQQESLRRLIQGHFTALEKLHAHPAEAARHMAPRTHLSEEEFIRSFDGLHMASLAENRQLFAAGAAKLKASARLLAELMTTQHMLRKPVEPEVVIQGLFDPCCLPEAR